MSPEVEKLEWRDDKPDDARIRRRTFLAAAAGMALPQAAKADDANALLEELMKLGQAVRDHAERSARAASAAPKPPQIPLADGEYRVVSQYRQNLSVTQRQKMETVLKLLEPGQVQTSAAAATKPGAANAAEQSFIEVERALREHKDAAKRMQQKAAAIAQELKGLTPRERAGVVGAVVVDAAQRGWSAGKGKNSVDYLAQVLSYLPEADEIQFLYHTPSTEAPAKGKNPLIALKKGRVLDLLQDGGWPEERNAALITPQFNDDQLRFLKERRKQLAQQLQCCNASSR